VFLLILETIGTQEIMLVGMVALIVFGPRKLPQIARKAGKIMREIKSVSNDFRSTWEREAAQEDGVASTKPLSFGSETDESERKDEFSEEINKSKNILPEVREVSKDYFNEVIKKGEEVEIQQSGKQDWL